MSPSDDLRRLVSQTTPGPWTWTHHERGPWQVGTVVDENEKQVSDYVDFLDLDDEGLTLVDFICEGGESSSADARLIALAPALAVLCADLVDLAEKTIYNPPGWSGEDVWWKPETDALLARLGDLVGQEPTA